MARTKLDLNLLRYINLFESISQARVKDCFEDLMGNLIFIVYPGEASKAIGKRGVNINKTSSLINKKIKVVEFNPDVEKFITNLIYPLKVNSVEFNDGLVIIKDNDRQKKSMLIGRNAKNLRFLESIVKKYFPQVNEIKVI
ncbi:MAG: transcription termination/antitermination protein NusA [Candidatus Woesearchaeota archaeon]|nr:transcription termination/antitermination protein NusA [Candidatus Woesearchaeota archaeon]MDN5328024.1 transcription termination/antitermination protein NusA [Candidatus Woesearchaeota archaeon]